MTASQGSSSLHSPRRCVPLAKAIEIGARLAMSEGCVFTGVSGDFDSCSSTTRQVYEKRAAEAFGVTLGDYYTMGEDE